MGTRTNPVSSWGPLCFAIVVLRRSVGWRESLVTNSQWCVCVLVRRGCGLRLLEESCNDGWERRNDAMRCAARRESFFDPHSRLRGTSAYGSFRKIGTFCC
jgi:hypothetical protein